MADRTYNINIRVGDPEAGSLQGQSTELSDNQNPTQLDDSLINNIQGSRASIGNNVADNSQYLGNVEIMRRGTAIAQSAVATGLNILNFQQSLDASTNGYQVASQLVSAGGVAIGVGTGILASVGIGTAFLPGIGTAIGFVAGLVVSPALERAGRIQNINKESQYVALTQAPIVNKR